MKMILSGKLKNLKLILIFFLLRSSLVFSEGDSYKYIVGTLPRSGTHLVQEILKSPCFQLSPSEINPKVHLLETDVLVCHLRYLYRYINGLPKNTRVLFLVRDPRDVVLSRRDYSARTLKGFARPNQSPDAMLKRKSLSNKERLDICLSGKRSYFGSPRTHRDLDYLEKILPIFDSYNITYLRFEDLTGKGYNTNAKKQRAALIKFAAFFNKAISSQEAKEIAEGFFDENKGNARWRELLTPDQARILSSRHEKIIKRFSYN